MQEILSTVWISERANLANEVYLGRHVRIFGQTHILAGTVIGDFVVIGHPSPTELDSLRHRRSPPTEFDKPMSLDSIDGYVETLTVIGQGSVIRGPTTIYSGVTTGASFDCAHNVTIREGSTIGHNCYLKVNTEIRREVVIGDGATLAGTVGDRCRVGNHVTSLGNLVHRYDRPGRGRIEAAPILEDFAFVGRGASVIGGVKIRAGAYVAAGAVVTKDVPPGALVMGAAATVYEGRSPMATAMRAGDDRWPF